MGNGLMCRKSVYPFFPFGVDEVWLSGDDAGLGMFVAGKPTEKDESVKVMIFKLRDEILCSQVVPCQNVDNPNHEIIECERDLR